MKKKIEIEIKKLENSPEYKKAHAEAKLMAEQDAVLYGTGYVKITYNDGVIDIERINPWERSVLEFDVRTRKIR